MFINFNNNINKHFFLCLNGICILWFIIEVFVDVGSV